MILAFEALVVAALVLLAIFYVKNWQQHRRNLRRKARHEAHVERLRAEWKAKAEAAAMPWSGVERRKKERVVR